MDKLESILKTMAGIEEPFDLFEPYLWYDKLGDSCWKCEVRSNCGILWSGSGDTPLEAAEKCYDEAMSPQQPKKRIKYEST